MYHSNARLFGDSLKTGVRQISGLLFPDPASRPSRLVCQVHSGANYHCPWNLCQKAQMVSNGMFSIVLSNWKMFPNLAKSMFCAVHHKKIFIHGVGKSVRGVVPTMPPGKTVYSLSYTHPAHNACSLSLAAHTSGNSQSFTITDTSTTWPSLRHGMSDSSLVLMTLQPSRR